MFTMCSTSTPKRTDLTKVIERLELSDDELNAITEDVDAYQQTLHTALIQRNAYLESAQKDIDQAMQLGASHPIGPLALADFVGLDVTLDIIDSFAAAFGEAKYRACPLLREMVQRGELGRKSGKGFFTYGD